MRVLRSVAVVILGYIIFAGTAALIFKLSGQEPHAAATMGFKILATLYGMFFAAIGGWIAARLSSRKPLSHAIAVGGLIAIGAIISLLFSGTTYTWSMWSALILMSPCAALGGKFHSRSRKASMSDRS